MGGSSSSSDYQSNMPNYIYEGEYRYDRRNVNRVESYDDEQAKLEDEFYQSVYK